ncbi:hypothetical protein GRF29_164g284972 [Pseudopithomyces chartarum]|uniref:Uncharacterized protein n=1 Tax=Pseudopithomyces chartarum TaxID=1892770 RepID=A0AAN6LSZ1_9PLEO|nr:hypothetical protein GRF29_164g284972 [Pseudopithomyces chartarum]
MAAPNSALDAPSAQLHLEQRAATVRALASRRPVLHHLNADTSWLLQIPRPASAVKRGARIYYNVLIDPWLRGGQSDVARWFSQQWHATESAVGTIAEVDALAGEMEVLAGGRRRGGEEGERTLIDAVAVSHEFTDHCHRETLEEVHGDVPVFATEQAAKLISSWNHFRTVIPTPTFSAQNPDWRSYSLPPLPSWLSISRVTAPSDALYYHSALLITFAPHASPAPTKKRASLSIFGEDDSPFDSDPPNASSTPRTGSPSNPYPPSRKPIPRSRPSLSCTASTMCLFPRRSN